MLDKMYAWTMQYMNWWVDFYTTHVGLTKAIIVGSSLMMVVVIGVLVMYAIPEFIKTIKAK